VTHHGEALGRESGDASLAEAVASGDLTGLTPRMAALRGYAIKLTRNPSAVREQDLVPLRDAGLNDRAIVDANQVVAYFNYVNRIAHGLGVELEKQWERAPQPLRGYALADNAQGIPVVSAGQLPWISVASMREVDRIMIEELGISLRHMMENAGSRLVSLIHHLQGGDLRGLRIAVLAGSGGNGGGGMVAARHLAVAGASVAVALASRRERLAAVTAEQSAMLERMGIPITECREPAGEFDLIVDALLGCGQSGSPRGSVETLIRWSAGRRVVSLDVPSGLELSSGRCLEPCVRAEATLTLALPKEGLRPHIGGAAGELYLADVSVPPLVHERIGLPKAPLFTSGALLRVLG
jgi:NAD(P)H-hydrate epimerase